MELILLLVLFVVVGFFLGRSRFSQTIDDTVGKVGETSKGYATRAGDWLRGLWGGRKAAEDVVDTEFVEDAEAEAEAEPQPARKRASRRKAE